MKKRITAALFLSVLISLLAAMNAFAGEWVYSPYASGSGGDWYYLDASGAMLAGCTRTIDGRSYRFDASGRWSP